MGAIISSLINPVNPELEEQMLHQAHNSAVGKAEKQAAFIEQQLRIAGSDSDNGKTVPISNVFSKTVVARVNTDTKSGLGALTKSIGEGIHQATNGDVTGGVMNLLTSTMDVFFGSFQGSVSQESKYYVIMVGRSLVRVDTFMYTECIKTSTKNWQVNVVVAYQSPVDISKLPLSSFITAYQYQCKPDIPYSMLVLQCKLYLELYKMESTQEGVQVVENIMALANKIRE